MSDNSAVNLLDHFALVSTQVVKLHAELLRAIAPTDVLQARVEIKLSPGKLEPQAELPEYQVGVRLLCDGSMTIEGESRAAFKIECVLNAGYRQLHGQPLPFEIFSRHHTSLTRQLYPLIHHQLVPLLSQLGIPSVRLPQDIVHDPKTKPQQIH